MIKNRFIAKIGKSYVLDAHKFCFFCSLSFTHFLFFPGGIFEASCGWKGELLVVFGGMSYIEMANPKPQFTHLEIGSNPTEVRSYA